MFVGYSAFANQGFTSEAMMVTKITDSNGNVIAQFNPRQEQALSKNGYARMLETLQSVVKNGTGRSMSSLGAAMGGKTGTTDFNADGWFMGFTPKLVFGAWVGGENKFIHLNMIGGRTALPICKRFMSKVYSDKTLPYKRSDKFAEFEDAVVYKKPIYNGPKESNNEATTTVEDVYD
jgi:penicillin-binding protein 1A